MSGICSIFFQYAATKASFSLIPKPLLSLTTAIEQCDPVLVWWLIEELLESQRIESCQVVFDYLDSRRERLVTHHLKNKKELVILRAFNELLRRLSRAEDAVFCGRVLIFLSQSFQLGARSATNHKGEFNLENVTVFEEAVPEPEDEPELSDAMSTDPEAMSDVVSGSEKLAPAITDSQTKATSSPSTMTTDLLYPIFWSLQRAFSNPPLAFEAKYLEEVKDSLNATLRKFKEVPKVIETSNTDSKKGLKRARDEEANSDDFASAFNPKYLTSKDLFKLEVRIYWSQQRIMWLTSGS